MKNNLLNIIAASLISLNCANTDFFNQNYETFKKESLTKFIIGEKVYFLYKNKYAIEYFNDFYNKKIEKAEIHRMIFYDEKNFNFNKKPDYILYDFDGDGNYDRAEELSSKGNYENVNPVLLSIKLR